MATPNFKSSYENKTWEGRSSVRAEHQNIAVHVQGAVHDQQGARA